MQFVRVDDFRTRPDEIWERLIDSDLVVTSNGQPVAILIDANSENLEEMLGLLCRLRTQMAVSRMRQSATDSGAAQLSIDMIEAEILEARTQK
jgi:PHD/YefM family antitoxin component YafN of YafNO toxin-antitoxin module